MIDSYHHFPNQVVWFTIAEELEQLAAILAQVHTLPGWTGWAHRISCMHAETLSTQATSLAREAMYFGSLPEQQWLQ